MTPPQGGTWDERNGPWPPPLRTGWRAAARRALIRLASIGHAPADPRDGIAILAYHGTPRDQSDPWWQDFAGHMAHLERLGYDVVSLDDAVARVRDGRISGPPTVAITFDDGWASNLAVAFPELSRRGWPSTLFLTTSFVDRRPFMSQSEVGRLAELGVTVELHTHSHPDLTTVDEPAIHAELEQCGTLIERWTGRRPEFFCYPFGFVDRRVRDAVARAGIKAACSGRPGRNLPSEDLLLLRRITISPGDTPADLEAALAGGLFRVRRILDFAANIKFSTSGRQGKKRSRDEGENPDDRTPVSS